MNDALKRSYASSGLRSASAEQQRSAGDGLSRSSSSEKARNHSCQSSSVERCRVSHALLSLVASMLKRLVSVDLLRSPSSSAAAAIRLAASGALSPSPTCDEWRRRRSMVAPAPAALGGASDGSLCRSMPCMIMSSSRSYRSSWMAWRRITCRTVGSSTR